MSCLATSAPFFDDIPLAEARQATISQKGFLPKCYGQFYLKMPAKIKVFTSTLPMISNSMVIQIHLFVFVILKNIQTSLGYQSSSKCPSGLVLW